MTLQVDLENLSAISNDVYGLGAEASRLRVHEPSLPHNWLLTSVVQAVGLARDVETGLVPALTARLHEIGNLMHQAEIEFATTDSENGQEILAATYTRTSGDWGPK